MSVQPTSLEAYRSLVHIGDKQACVLSIIITQGQCTDKEIARALGWEINRVTPRRNELVERGLIKEVGTRVQNGRRVILWSVNTDLLQTQTNNS